MPHPHPSSSQFGSNMPQGGVPNRNSTAARIPVRPVGYGQAGNSKRRKILRDNIQGVTKGAIRRLARRGGVKRISAQIYPEVRGELRRRLSELLREICAVVQYANRKTICTSDVVFVLARQGHPIYGFGDKER